MSLAKQLLGYSGVALVLMGGAILLLKPFASCSLYVDLLLVSYCQTPIKDFGLDPNIFGAVILIPSGMALLIGAIRVR